MIRINQPAPAPSRLALQFEKDSGSTPKFFKDEVVQGRVVRSLSQDTLLLHVKGKSVMARTSLRLSEGRVLSLKVDRISPVPILKLIGIKSPDSEAPKVPMILSALKENLWKSLYQGTDHDGITREQRGLLRESINDLSRRIYLKPTPHLLGEMIDRSGLRWEAKLRGLIGEKGTTGDQWNRLWEGDLKGMISKFAGHKEEGGGLLNKFLSVMENIQLLNHLGIEQERKIFLPLPIQFPDGMFAPGQLLIHLPEEEKDEAGPRKRDKDLLKVTFLLEFSNLGPLRADITLQGKEIAGRFLLAEEASKNLVEENLPYLINKFRERGFSILRMECRLRDPETIIRPLITEMIHEEGHNISLVA